MFRSCITILLFYRRYAGYLTYAVCKITISSGAGIYAGVETRQESRCTLKLTDSTTLDVNHAIRGQTRASKFARTFRDTLRKRSYSVSRCKLKQGTESTVLNI